MHAEGVTKMERILSVLIAIKRVAGYAYLTRAKSRNDTDLSKTKGNSVPQILMMLCMNFTAFALVLMQVHKK